MSAQTIDPSFPHDGARPEAGASQTEKIDVSTGGRIALGVLGAVTILGGLLAFFMPVLGGVALTLVVGAAFIVSGLLQGWHVFADTGWRARALAGLSALLYVAGGALLLLDPLSGTVALSLLMIAIFLIDGVVRTVIGLQIRPRRGWGWMVGSGVLSAIAATILILFFLPTASLTLLGLMAGLSLMLEGWAFVFLAFTDDPIEVPKAPETTA